MHLNVHVFALCSFMQLILYIVYIETVYNYTLLCYHDERKTNEIYNIPGGCLGFVSLTDLRRSLAFFTSLQNNDR